MHPTRMLSKRKVTNRAAALPALLTAIAFLASVSGAAIFSGAPTAHAQIPGATAIELGQGTEAPLLGEGQYSTKLRTEPFNRGVSGGVLAIPIPDGYDVSISATAVRTPPDAPDDLLELKLEPDSESNGCDVQRAAASYAEGLEQPVESAVLAFNSNDVRCTDPLYLRLNGEERVDGESRDLDVDILISYRPTEMPSTDHTYPDLEEDAPTSGDVPRTEEVEIDGAQTFSDSPAIAPGTTATDSLGAGETHIFRVSVPWGQRPKVTFRSESDELRLTAYTPERELIHEPAELVGGGDGTTVAGRFLTKPDVRDFYERLPADFVAGDYYFAVTQPSAAAPGNGEESAFSLSAELDGAPSGSDAWTPQAVQGPQPGANPGPRIGMQPGYISPPEEIKGGDPPSDTETYFAWFLALVYGPILFVGIPLLVAGFIVVVVVVPIMRSRRSDVEGRNDPPPWPPAQ